MGTWLLGGTQTLENPDFEVGSTAHWFITGTNITLAVSSIDQYSGSYSALMTVAGTSSGWTSLYQTDLFTLVAGNNYFVRFAMKVASGTMPDAGVASWEITNSTLSSLYVSAGFVVSTLWEPFGFSWTQETTVTSLKFSIYVPAFTNPASDNGGVFFDDITIYRAVELESNYGYKFGKTLNRIDNHDRDGGLHSYILPGGYRQFEFPGLSINSAGRCAVNSFWSADDTCYLIENDSDPTSLYAVKIMEVQEPFQSFEPPGMVRFIGDLKLETVDAE